MKLKHFYLLLLFALSLNAVQAQISTVIANKVIVKDSIRIGGKWYNKMPDSSGGGVTDTASLSARINAKVNASDTLGKWVAWMKRSGDTVYIQKAGNWVFAYLDSVGSGSGSPTDTTSLSNRINAKVNISDTAAKWVSGMKRSGDSVYMRKGSTWIFVFLDSLGSGGGSPTDTTSLSNRINAKVNISDTAGKWITGVRRSGDSVYVQKGGVWSFAFLDSLGAGGTPFDSLTAQGGVFHTGAFNDLRYRLIGDTAYAHYLMTREWAYKMRDSVAAVTASALAGKQATGNYMTGLTGNVVATGPGAAAATIQPHVVANSMQTQMVARTVKANITGGTSDAADVPIDTLASHITPDSVRIYRKPGTDSVFFCVTPISTGIEKCVFEYHDSIGAGGGSSFDSSTSQGGGFHTGNFNDSRYRQILDTLFAHLLMTRAWGYKISDSLAADYISRIASKRDITDTSFAHLLMTRAWGYKVSDSVFAVVNAALSGKQAQLSGTGYVKFASTTPSYLTPTQVTADLNVFTTTLKGLVPAPGTINGYFLGDDGAYHAVSGGSTPGLQQVLSVNNHANTRIIDSAAIHSDSLITRNALAHGNVTIGDTAYSTPIIAVANGSSITAGNYGTPWYAQVLSNNFHWSLTNQSQVGTSLAPPLANSLISRINLTPYVGPSAYFFCDLGVNDTLTNLTTYQNYAVAMIDSLIVHGFVASHILINSPPFSPSRKGDSIYVTPDSLACVARGCVFVNILTPMKTAYYAGNTGIIYPDSLHPSTSGHAMIAQLDIHALYGIQRTANLIVNGSTTEQDDTVTRNQTVGGTVNPMGGLVNRADNTTIPITAAKALAFGNYAGLTFRANVTTPDTGSNFHVRYVAQATRSNFDIVDSKAGVEDTVMHVVGANTNIDAIVFRGSTVQTGYPFTFNGSSYIAGSIKVTGGYSFGGDNGINSIKMPMFSGSGNVYGFGNDGSNNMLIGDVFGQIQFGGYAGGTSTFTPHSAFSANGTKLFVGTVTDNGNGDVLQVNGTMAATMVNLAGDATYRNKAYPFFWNGSNWIGGGIVTGTNEVQWSNAFGRTSWGTGSGGSFVANSQFNTSATRLSINSTDDGINALRVGGRLLVTDTAKLPNIARKLLDSANYKPMVVDASGNIFKTDWSTFGGTSTPFSDASALVKNGTDATKLAIFSAAGISTATTRTYGLPDFNGTFAMTNHAQSWTGAQDYTGATVTVTTQTAGDASGKPASTLYVDNLNAVSNTFTSTLSANTNVASVTFNSAKYIRTGNQVIGQISATVTPTASSLPATINFSLPITTTNGTQTYIAEGSAYQSGAAGAVGVGSVTSTTGGAFQFYATSTAAYTVVFHFFYSL